MSIFREYINSDRKICSPANVILGGRFVKNYHNESAMEAHTDLGGIAPKPLTNVEKLIIAADQERKNIADIFEGVLPPSVSYQTLRDAALVGGDPEWFFANPKNGFMVPSFHAMGTTVDERRVMCENEWSSRPLMRYGQRHLDFFYPDGYQVELAYNPVPCMAHTCDDLRAAIQKMYYWAKNHNLTVSNATVKKITPATVKKYGEVPLGCRPSRNAYGDDTTVHDPNPMYRFTGGHFHFGFGCTQKLLPVNGETLIDEQLKYYNIFTDTLNLANEGDEWINKHIDPKIQLLDKTVGLMSLAICGEYESKLRRRYMYGRAGDYRITPFTLEYRVPSNVAWFHPVVWHILGMTGRRVLGFYGSQLSAASASRFNFLPTDDVKQIINETDYVAARKLIGNSNYIQILNQLGCLTYAGLDNAQEKRMLNLLNNGLAGTYGNDIADNWKIDKVWIPHSGSADACFNKAFRLDR